MANPPFGAKAGARRIVRDDIRHKNANKQLLFLQHICQSLRPNGRAAVIVPDNVLFEAGVAALIRKELLEEYNLHTILRLPQGIFYSAGVKTNVLFFNGKGTSLSHPNEIWIYDLRTNMPRFGRSNPLNEEHSRNSKHATAKTLPASQSEWKTAKMAVFARSQEVNSLTES